MILSTTELAVVNLNGLLRTTDFFRAALHKQPHIKKQQVADIPTLVRPVVTYGSESWTLTMKEERALAVFEREILREIYGPVKENELWRIRPNDELEAMIKGENIVRFIKGQRIQWLGHMERMQHTAIPKKMYGKLYATRR